MGCPPTPYLNYLSFFPLDFETVILFHRDWDYPWPRSLFNNSTERGFNRLRSRGMTKCVRPSPSMHWKLVVAQAFLVSVRRKVSLIVFIWSHGSMSGSVSLATYHRCGYISIFAPYPDPYLDPYKDPTHSQCLI
jgi:hypothetical protein